jgi:hypothetical protein
MWRRLPKTDAPPATFAGFHAGAVAHADGVQSRASVAYYTYMDDPKARCRPVCSQSTDDNVGEKCSVDSSLAWIRGALQPGDHLTARRSQRMGQRNGALGLSVLLAPRLLVFLHCASDRQREPHCMA